MGRYTFLREIAKGPFGPLYELRAEGEATGLGGLARLVTLPDELPPEVEQSIAETAWESMELRHDFILNVADVVFGTGWVTLIHDYAEGTLLRSLQRRAQERQSAFPVPIALRVVLDVLEGLDRNHGACESTGIAWNPGGVAATSLYVCGDGRTRLLDGQLMTTLVRAKAMREHASGLECLAPELTDEDGRPDERADVFAAGAVLWELITGHELTLDNAVAHGQRPRARLPSVSLSAPKGATIPLSVTHAVRAALELDATKRPATRSELRSLLSKAAEAAPYEKLIDYVDALLHRESTLFRLTLDAPPKLSDKLRSERPKPPRFNRDLDLSTRGRPAQAPKVAKFPPRAPPKPSLPTTRAVEGPALAKSMAHRTLIGISPGSLQESRFASPTAVAEPAVVSSLEPEPEPEAAKVVELNPFQVDSVDSSDTDETVLVLKRAPSASPGIPTTEPAHPPAFASGVHSAKPVPVSTLLQEVLREVPVKSEVLPAPSIDSKRPPAGAPVVQLRLRTIVIGLLATVIVAVASTIVTVRLVLNNSPGAASALVSVQPAPSVAPQPNAPEAAQSVPSIAPPSPAAIASAEPAQAAPSAVSSAPPVASAGTQRPITPASAAATDGSPMVPKVTVRKRKRQYTPHGL